MLLLRGLFWFLKKTKAYTWILTCSLYYRSDTNGYCKHNFIIYSLNIHTVSTTDAISEGNASLYYSILWIVYHTSYNDGQCTHIVPLKCDINLIHINTRVSEQTWLKSTCSAKDTSKQIKFSIKQVWLLFRERISTALLRRHVYTGWSAPLLFVWNKVTFSSFVVQLCILLR